MFGDFWLMLLFYGICVFASSLLTGILMNKREEKPSDGEMWTMLFLVLTPIINIMYAGFCAADIYTKRF
jgi:uncharacterized membrane protein YhaH (DUF805 family)